MLTVFREMAHSIARQLAHLEPRSSGSTRRVPDEEQDAVLAEVLSGRSRTASAAVDAHPRAARGAARVRRRRRRRLRPGPDPRRRRRRPARRREAVAGGRPPRAAAAAAAPTTRTAATATAPTSSSPAAASSSRDFLPRLEGLGDSVLVVGDEATLKVHVHTDEPEAAVALFEGAGEVTNLDVADMREQIAERDARGSQAPAARGVVAVAAGDGLRAALRRARRPRRPRRRDAQPLDLRAARRDPRGRRRGSPRPAQLLERDHGRRARLRALREAGPGGPGDLAAGEPAGPGRARPDRRDRTRTPSGWTRRSPGSRAGGGRPGRARRRPGPLRARATRSASSTTRSSPGAARARPWRRRSSSSPRGPRSSP